MASKAAASIAIIGGGVGGASTSYYLRRLLGEDVDLDVYERSPFVGGRTRSVQVDGKFVELGASIIYTGNRTAKLLAEEAGLTQVPPGGAANGRLGLYDGRGIVFVEASNQWLFVWDLLWRYGLQVLWTPRIVSRVLDRWNKIYDELDAGRSFRHPLDMLDTVGLGDLTKVSFESYMLQEFGTEDSKYLREMLHAVNKVNYNSSNDLNALSGCVSLCPMVTGSLFTIEEGIQQIAVRTFQSVKAAVHVNAEVTEVRSRRKRTADGGGNEYLVYVSGRHVGTYDAVVVACPLEQSAMRITLDGKDVGKGLPKRRYNEVHTTFLRGKIRPSFFSWEGPDAKFPESVLMTEDAAGRTALSSLTRYWSSSEAPTPISGVYKTFTSKPQAAEVLDALFDGDYEVLHAQPWGAYPILTPGQAQPAFEVQAGHHVYLVNALEGYVSAIEVSCMAGRNVAMLCAEDLGAAAGKPAEVAQ